MRWNKRNFGILKVCRKKEHGRKKRVTRMEKLQKTITELNDKLKLYDLTSDNVTTVEEMVDELCN